jgi:phosphoribosyl 1,2-cyclic phosphodiesterase/CheY-like chemotaxis protein
VEVRSARGTLVVIDCGTGLYALGQKLMASGAKNLRGYILIGHTHWDHIQGVPFFAPLFVPGNTWDIYGPKGLDQSLRETLAGQMQHTYFPVAPDQFGATIRYHDLLEGTFTVDDVKVSTHYLNHPALTLGYRLEADGVTVAYCCDHEPFSRALASGDGELAGQDLRHADFVHDADLLIHDAQYTAAEYPSKVGWGHSSYEYAAKVARHADVKRLAVTHHDPMRNDDALDRIMDDMKAGLQASGSLLEMFAAAEGHGMEVEPSRSRLATRGAAKFQATTQLEPALAERSVLLNVADASMAAALSEAIRAEGIRPNFFSDIAEARKLIAKYRPSLAIIEHDTALVDGMTICRAIRQEEGDQFPIVVVAAQEDSAAGAAAGVTEWLLKPFTASYARTKIRAWVLRTACRWMRGAVPDNEQRRLASLRNLKILDTEPEERFDRVTRLATALFDVPVAIISLVDENRQWFKSCAGVDVKETSRDVAFCSHVVYKREPMVVADTFLDERFADNPMVVNEPRIRFYAGYPLILGDGSCIGTLCLLDTRPRTIDGPALARLHDLADIALQEVRSMRPSGGESPDESKDAA